MNRYDDLQRRTEALRLLAAVTRKNLFFSQQVPNAQILTIEHNPPITLNAGDTITLTAKYEVNSDDGRMCVSYRTGVICADGFIQKPYCSGRGGCHSCEHITIKSLPYCLSDELPEHMANDNGTPLFYGQTES